MLNNNKENMTININSGTIIKVVLVLLAFVALYILKDLFLVILTAVVTASAIEPATRWFKKYRVPRLPAVILIYLFLATFIIGLFYSFVPPIVDEFSNLTAALPRYIESVEVYNLSGESSGFFDIKGIINNIAQDGTLTDIVSNIKDTIASVSGGFFGALSVIFGGVFSFFLIIVISFYLAVQERGIENFLKIVVPIKHEKYILGLWQRVQKKIGLWIQGQLILALLIGVLVYLGLTILGVKYALLLAILAAVFELIPVFGPILAAIPAVIIGFLDSLTGGLMVLGFYVIIQQFENNLIYPLVVQKVVGVPPLLVIISLVVGANLAGFLGVLLSVPIAAALVEYIHDVEKDKHPELYKQSNA